MSRTGASCKVVEYRSWTAASGLGSKKDNGSCLQPFPSPKAYLIPHRYYHTLFTHSLTKALRTLVDDTPACVDVLMNFLIATVTRLPPIKVPYGRQRQDAAPLVRGPWGLVRTRKARVGKGKRADSLLLSKPALAAAGVRAQTSFVDTFSLPPLRSLRDLDPDRSLSLRLRTASTVWQRNSATCLWCPLECEWTRCCSRTRCPCNARSTAV